MSFLAGGLTRRYGDAFTVRLAGYGKLVMLSSPAAIRDVFRGDPHGVLHSGEGNAFLSVTVGPRRCWAGAVTPHARQRRVLLPPLKGTRMRLYFAAMQTATLDVIRAWPRGQPIPHGCAHAADHAADHSQAVLGLTPGPRLDEFERLVRDLMATTRSRFGLILMKILPLGLLRQDPGDAVFSVNSALDRSRRTHPQREPRCRAEPCGDNVLAIFLAATHDDGRPLSDREIRDAMVTLLIAGFETTALRIA